MLRTTALALLAALCLAPALGADPCSSIAAARFHPDKVRLGAEVGRSGSPEARSCLLRLLHDESSWNREAAVAGLLRFEDAEVTEALVTRMLGDLALRDDVGKGAAQFPSRFFPVLAAAYGRGAEAGPRRLLLDTLAVPGSRDAERFLKEKLAEAGNPDRAEALRLLTSRYGAANEALVRASLDDPELLPVALEHVVGLGRPDDLPLFQRLVASADPRIFPLAYRGIARAGGRVEQEAALLSALEGGEPPRVQAALVALPDARSERLTARLCRSIETLADPSTAMLVAEHVAGFADAAHARCLVPALALQYSTPAKGVGELAGSILTAGVLGILTDASSMLSKRSFDKRRKKVLERLEALTGQHLGAEAAPWLDWVVCSGHTVGGTNLLQRLFAPDRTARERALGCAREILGPGGPPLPTDEASLLPEVARRLIAKGLLQEPAGP